MTEHGRLLPSRPAGVSDCDEQSAGSAAQRRWRRSLAGLALSFTLLAQMTTAPAVQIDVGVDDCTLGDAITAANDDRAIGGCPAGSGPDTIGLPAGSTQTLTSIDNLTFGPTGLPLVRSTLVIDGNGSIIARDPAAPAFRILAVDRSGDLILQETTVIGGRIPSSTPNRKGAGIANYGSLVLTDSTIAGNTAALDGGGLYNAGSLTVIRSTVSGNTAGDDGGGIRNDGTASLINSTVSGNSVTDKAGGIRNSGTLSLTSSTVSFNSTQGAPGGILNKGILILATSLISGNRAAGVPAEIRNRTAPSATAISGGFNLFGHDGAAGIMGFATGVTDGVASVPLSALLDPALAADGTATATHALIPGSPAIDAIPAGSCGTSVEDQRGVARPQDGDGDTLAGCDIGAFELQLPPPPPPPPSPPPPPPPPAPLVVVTPVDRIPQARCRRSSCRIRLSCDVLQGSGMSCTSPVNVFVRAPALRGHGSSAARASRRIRFATGVAGIPPGETGMVRLRLTRRGREFVRTTTRRTVRGTLEIQNVTGMVRANVTLRIRR